MKSKEILKLAGIDVVFIILMFICTYALTQLQVFIGAVVSESFFNSMDSNFLIASVNAVLQISFYPIFSLFYTYALYKTLHCSNMKKVILLNSVAFCVITIASNYLLGMLHLVDIAVYLSIFSSTISVVITQIVVVLLFIKNSNKQNKITE